MKTHSSVLSIHTVAGCLNEFHLQSIGQLYGKHVDPRYSNLHYVDTLFNRNPWGRSYVAFVMAGDTAVGCHAIIPYTITSRGDRIKAGKFECFYVKEEYRKRRIVSEWGDALPGVLMIKVPEALARQDDIQVIFALTTEAVGRLYQFNGYTPLSGVLNHRYYLLHPERLRQLQRSRPLRLFGVCLAAGQHLLCRLTAPVAAFGECRHFALSSGGTLDNQLALTANHEWLQNHQWSIAMTRESLNWWHQLGYVDVITMVSHPEIFGVVTDGSRGGNMEILDWTAQGDLRNALALLRHIIAEARRRGAASISFANTPHLLKHRDLARAAALLGFVARSVRRTIHVSATDAYFLDTSSLYFNWLFSL